MDINECFLFLNYLSNKNQSGNVSPDNFNLGAQRAQIEYYNKEYRIFQSTREVTDAIAIWLIPTIINPDANGQVNYPADYKHVSGIRHLYWVNGKAIPVAVREVSNNDLGKVLMSAIAPPTLKYPVMSYYNTYMQFFPVNVSGIQFDYLREPIVPKWAFTIINNRPVYDPINSVNFEALDGSQTEIIMMMLSYLGIYLSQPQVVQYAEMMKNENV